jgi:hypothetical protein
MALFNLLGGGISFGNEQRTSFNPLVSSKYDQKLLRYPSDLGTTDKGHYMVININEQINTSFPGTASGDKTASQVNSDALRELNGGINTADGLATASKTAGVILDSVKNGINNFSPTTGEYLSKGLNFIDEVTGVKSLMTNLESGIGVRTIRRITDTVALYMPDTLNFTYAQAYSKLAPGGSLAQTALSALNSASETYKNSGNTIDVKNQLRNAAPFIANYLLRNSGDVGKILFTAGTGGKVENPMMEMLYSSPEFRSFRFDFIMMPRSEREAEEVQNIINLLRFHQAPEIVRNSGGFFLYPPSEFDISFYYNGTENINIPKVSTCVLTNIDTDYAPGGFAAYEVEGEPGVTKGKYGRTGMPVAIRLSLSFTETEYLVKGSPLLPSMKPFSPQVNVNQEANRLQQTFGASMN